MLITKEIEIDMAHRVPNHGSKCRNLHGHRYKIEVGVDDKLVVESGAPDEGMVIDFSDLKGIMISYIDVFYDHNMVLDMADPLSPLIQEIEKHQNKQVILVPFVPTAENLAKHWFEILEPKLKDRGIKLKHVKIWETPTSTALFTKD